MRSLAEHAPLIFRGEVVEVKLAKNQADYKEGVAVIAVDRWYRSGALQEPSLVDVRFAWDSGVFFQAHNCADLVISSHWIFFAKLGSGPVLELFHDCEGALTVSPLLAGEVSGDVLSRMEADFRAGLSDSDSSARIASVQRLAGLGLPISRVALREVIASGTETESKWAVFAALKTGDASVMSSAVPLLLSLHRKEAKQYQEPGGMAVSYASPYPQPEGLIAIAIQKLRTPEAVPGLIELLNEASDEVVRDCASQALMEIKDPRASDGFASHLTDPSQYVRYNSLIGLEYITHAPACSVAKPEDAEAAELRCREWWDSHH